MKLRIKYDADGDRYYIEERAFVYGVPFFWFWRNVHNAAARIGEVCTTTYYYNQYESAEAACIKFIQEYNRHKHMLNEKRAKTKHKYISLKDNSDLFI